MTSHARESVLVTVTQQEADAGVLTLMQMKAEPSLSGMKEQELKKTVMPFAQMRMKETNQLGPEVSSAAVFRLGLVVL